MPSQTVARVTPPADEEGVVHAGAVVAQAASPESENGLDRNQYASDSDDSAAIQADSGKNQSQDVIHGHPSSRYSRLTFGSSHDNDDDDEDEDEIDDEQFADDAVIPPPSIDQEAHPLDASGLNNGYAHVAGDQNALRSVRAVDWNEGPPLSSSELAGIASLGDRVQNAWIAMRSQAEAACQLKSYSDSLRRSLLTTRRELRQARQ